MKFAASSARYRIVPAPVLAAVLLLTAVASSRAETAVTINHNGSDAAGPEFHFKTVPPPRRTAAIDATFSLTDGTPDPNGAPLDALHDGKLPDEDDQADKNFFFQAGEDGGRLLVDLGKVIPVKEVDTYSWHADTRGPQVYKLYGSDGTDKSFNAQPKRPLDPAAAGWKLLASVDTRPAFKMDGGQYGVSVAATDSLGNFRYLLFDAAATETNDAFGNTFFSEVAVVNRDVPPTALAGLAALKKESHTYNEGGLELVWVNDDPTFDPAERDRMVKAFFTVYPLMAKEFNPNATKHVRISIEGKYRGVAATAGSTIHVNPRWFHQNPEDLDVVTHEGMHVVQAYKQWDPAWLREGLADYARAKFGVNNPAAKWTMPDYSPRQNYTDAYRVTARFLVWLEKHVKPGLAVALDDTLRQGKYAPETWNKLAGKSVDELWADYAKNPAL